MSDLDLHHHHSKKDSRKIGGLFLIAFFVAS